jgi:hypothetical protein
MYTVVHEHPKVVHTIVHEWLSREIPIFRDKNSKFSKQLSNDRVYGYLYGLVQSGKTLVQVGLAFHDFLLKNRSTIWILRNSKSDQLQAISNIKNLVGTHSFTNPNGWRYFCKERGISSNVPKIVFKMINSNTTFKNNELEDILTSKTPTILICLANYIQFKKLENVCKTLGGDKCNFNIIIDESDALTGDSQRVECITNLNTFATSILGVSATSFSVLFSDTTLTSDNMFILPVDSKYRGISDFRWHTIEPPNQCEDGPPGVFSDTEILPYMKHLMTKYPGGISIKTCAGQEVLHPVILLLKVSQYNVHFDEFVRHFCTSRDKTWLVISYSKDGVIMYHNSFVPNSSIKIRKRSSDTMSTYNPNNSRIVRVKNVEIGDILEYARSWGILRFSHIAIIAGRLADRGINFTSNNYSVSGVWHISHMYFKPTKSSDCTSLMQSMRPCGKFNDNMIPTIATTTNVRDDLLRAFKVQTDIVNDINMQNTDRFTFNCVRDINIDVDSMPVKKLSKKLACEKIMNITGKKYNNASDVEWGITTLLHNVQRHVATRTRTIIISILQLALDDGDTFSSKSCDVIKQVCGKTKTLTHYTRWCKSQGDYKLLVPDPNNKKFMIINPEVSTQLLDIYRLNRDNMEEPEHLKSTQIEPNDIIMI